MVAPSQLVPQAASVGSRIKTPQQETETPPDTLLLAKHLDWGLDDSDRATRGEGLKDRWVRTTILQLIAQVGSLQLRVHASASLSFLGDRWKKPLLCDSFVGKAGHAGKAEIGRIISDSQEGVLARCVAEQHSY
jgi:hypothetical protein